MLPLKPLDHRKQNPQHELPPPGDRSLSHYIPSLGIVERESTVTIGYYRLTLPHNLEVQ
jgi:hypothetical protein